MSGFSPAAFNSPNNYAAKVVNPIYNPAPAVPTYPVSTPAANAYYADYRNVQFGQPLVKVAPQTAPFKPTPQPTSSWGLQGYVPPTVDPIIAARQMLQQLFPPKPATVAPVAQPVYTGSISRRPGEVTTPAVVAQPLFTSPVTQPAATAGLGILQKPSTRAALPVAQPVVAKPLFTSPVVQPALTDGFGIRQKPSTRAALPKSTVAPTKATANIKK